MTKHPTDYGRYTERLDIRLRDTTKMMLETLTPKGSTMSAIARDILEQAVIRRYKRMKKRKDMSTENSNLPKDDLHP
jgi:hypothetical protein